MFKTGMGLSQAVVSANTNGDNTLVAAVAGKRIRVYKWRWTVAGTVSLTWKSGSTALSGAMPFLSGGGDSENVSPDGEPWYQTAAGEALVMGLNAAVLIAGTVWYDAA